MNIALPILLCQQLTLTYMECLLDSLGLAVGMKSTLKMKRKANSLLQQRTKPK